MEQLEGAEMRLKTQVKPALEEESCYLVQGRGLPAKGPALTRSCWSRCPRVQQGAHSPCPAFRPALGQPRVPIGSLLLEFHVILTDTLKDLEVGFVSTFRRQPEAGEIGKLD